jgi:hypothetical protein
MALNIRPFNAEASTMPADDDSRTTTFMDGLRTRVASSDEKQRKQWEKSVKPKEVRSKPLTPARPDWLNTPENLPAEPKPAMAKRFLPFALPKRKPVRSNGMGDAS